MRPSSTHALFRWSAALVAVLVAGGSTLACTGVVAPIPGDPGSPVAPTADAGTDASPGDPDCSRLGVPELARVCPDGTSVGGSYEVENGMCVLEFPCPTPTPAPACQSVVNGACEQGGACAPGDVCATAASGSSQSSAMSCTCDDSCHLQCTTSITTDDAGAVPAYDSGVGPIGWVDAGPPDPPPPPPSPPVDAGEGHADASSSPDPDASSSPPPLVCDGPLPQSCELCSDGGYECAHYVVIDGKCEIRYCD